MDRKKLVAGGAVALGIGTAVFVTKLLLEPEPAQLVAVTDEHGRYHLVVPLPENDCVEGVLSFECPETNVNASISSLDAAWILDSVVGSRDVDLKACDVTGDGTCSASDAAAILAFQVGKPNSYSTGKWLAPPVPITLCPGDDVRVDTTVRVLGDVTGSWIQEQQKNENKD
jgi:hypothetical protein